MGVDSCGFSVSSAQAFWSNTPYYNLGIYIGGDEAGCPYSSSFASSVLSQGWHLMPLWVGPQSACGSWANTISDNTSTAFSQGETQEYDAASTLSSWGWNITDTPLIYDLEAYNTGNSTCVAAAKSFIAGWDYDASISPPQLSGVYGSSCGSDLSAFASLGSNNPYFIFGADWDGNGNTNVLACVSSSYWVNHQRLKQYQGGHDETWNGVTVNVDSDCANGPMYPAGDTASEGCT
jgi:hypothetical protein